VPFWHNTIHGDTGDGAASPLLEYVAGMLQLSPVRSRPSPKDGADIGDTAYPSAIETIERWADYKGCSVEGLELDLGVSIAGPETTVTRYADGCRAGGSSELRTIRRTSHVPDVSGAFGEIVVEWLLAHPKS
jgi:polyhydroxybutyrate depolymerase